MNNANSIDDWLDDLNDSNIYGDKTKLANKHVPTNISKKPHFKDEFDDDDIFG